MARGELISFAAATAAVAISNGFLRICAEPSMTARLIVIAFVDVVLMGYAPRWLTNGSEAWIIWVAAAAMVYGGPRLLRHLGQSALSRMRSVRLPIGKPPAA